MLEEIFQSELNSLAFNDPKRKELQEKIQSIKTIREKIRPINDQRFHTNSDAQRNCVYVAEECVKVLAGLKEPQRAPLKSGSQDIVFRRDNDKVVYHEVLSTQQAHLVTFQDFIETINLIEPDCPIEINLLEPSSRGIAKYIQSSWETLISNLQSLPGSNESEGKDKTLTGLIYYYYEDKQAGDGHLANFFRTKEGNLFFVDAQNEEISETPPQMVFNVPINKNEVFYFVAKPSSGYYIKKEKEIFIKQEPEFTPITQTPSSTFKLTPKQRKNSTQNVELTAADKALIKDKIQKLFDDCPNLGKKTIKYKSKNIFIIIDDHDISAEKILLFLKKYIFGKQTSTFYICEKGVIIKDYGVTTLREKFEEYKINPKAKVNNTQKYWQYVNLHKKSAIPQSIFDRSEDHQAKRFKTGPY